MSLPKNKDERFMTREDVASAMQISLVKLDRMRSEGKAPAEFTIGRAVRFKTTDFEAWLRKQRTNKPKKKSFKPETLSEDDEPDFDLDDDMPVRKKPQANRVSALVEAKHRQIARHNAEHDAAAAKRRAERKKKLWARAKAGFFVHHDRDHTLRRRIQRSTQTIIAVLPTGDIINISIDKNDGHLTIRKTGSDANDRLNKNGHLTVTPHASNVIHVV